MCLYELQPGTGILLYKPAMREELLFQIMYSLLIVKSILLLSSIYLGLLSSYTLHPLLSPYGTTNDIAVF